MDVTFSRDTVLLFEDEHNNGYNDEYFDELMCEQNEYLHEPSVEAGLVHTDMRHKRVFCEVWRYRAEELVGTLTVVSGCVF